eukprot:symbB.v1.2.021119.t1/scaffold1808.1/size103924/11
MGKPTKMPVAMKSMKSKGVQKGKASKGKASKAKSSKTKVKAVDTKPTKIGKGTLRQALQATMKNASGRNDLEYSEGSSASRAVADGIPVEDRAGYPVKLQQGAVDPAEWRTTRGEKIEVDFNRVAWLPDAWGQGIKVTKPISRSTGGKGGTLTMFVSPDGKTAYFHKPKVEKYEGRKLTSKEGFNGQVRLAKLQAEQTIELARAEMKQMCAGGNGASGADPDEEFFKLLSKAERKFLPQKEEFHFCVVSARRAKEVEGVKDIFQVQTHLVLAGITPTWYVDSESLGDYRALGLNAVVGGKLTPSRNKALDDAKKLNKICVQLSDDISSWEYRHGPRASEKTDDALNQAWNNARRYVVGPVAAARWIIAMMRASPEQPKLGGVYPLGSCARTFAGDEFGFKHFIIGDFFVVDHGSAVRFDETMTLKEDYDFCCSHIKAHGAVMRCNRMTLTVKHYSNSGGAVDNRDKKGKQEQANIEILHRKWPGTFRANPKRENEVIMRWRGIISDDDEIISTGHGLVAKTSKKDARSTQRVRKTIDKKAKQGGA